MLVIADFSMGLRRRHRHRQSSFLGELFRPRRVRGRCHDAVRRASAPGGKLARCLADDHEVACGTWCGVAHELQRHVAACAAGRDVGAVGGEGLDHSLEGGAHRVLGHELDERERIVSRLSRLAGGGSVLPLRRPASSPPWSARSPPPRRLDDGHHGAGDRCRSLLPRREERSGSDGAVLALRLVKVARRLTGPRTGVRSRNTHPTPGTGLPPIRRPSSKTHG